MSTSSNYFIKRNTAIICLLIINFLFSFKYLARITDFAWLIALSLSWFYWLLLADKLKINFSEKTHKQLPVFLIVLFIIIISIVFVKINIESLNADRWSVISSFWEAAFAGEYPYMAKSHMGNIPGPMPFYYVLTLPFFLIGELGYFSLLGLLILYYLISKTRTSKSYKLSIIIFLITSTFFLWEVVVRSNIFTTSILIVFFLYGFIQRKSNTNFSFYLFAIIAGLLLSTRAVFSIPYIIFFMYAILKKEVTFLEMSKFVTVAFIAFASTFLPLLISYPKEFLEINPFIVQSTFLVPFYYTVGFIAIAFIFPFMAKSKNELFYWSGLCLFLVILIFILYNLSIRGIQEFFIGISADISYFILCIPFFMFYLLNTNNFKSQKVAKNNKFGNLRGK